MRSLAIAALALAPSCAVVLNEDDGNRVRVVLTATQWPALETRPGLLQRADGSEVIVERAYVAWARVTLVPCGASTLPARVNAARASHGPDTSLMVSRPTLEGLLSHHDAILAELRPPSDTYCRAIIGVAAPDVDTGPDDLDMRGASLLVDGFWRTSPEAAWRAFSLRESAAFDVAVDLDDREIADGDNLDIVLSRSADAWLDGVELDAPDAARDLLTRLHESTTVALR